MFQQDPERTQLTKDITEASNYCTTSQLEAVLKLMECFKEKNEGKDGTSKKAPIRSMANTSKEDN